MTKTRLQHLAFILLSLGLYALGQSGWVDINRLCVGLILLFGIPHGAIDHILNENFSSASRKKNHFILRYVALIAGYLILWVFFPLRAFILFIFISMFHFGQEFVEDTDTPKGLHIVFYVLFGSVILLNPMLIHYEAVDAFVQEIIQVSLPPLAWATRLYACAFIGLAALVSLMILWRRGWMDRGDLFNAIVFFSLISLAYGLFSFMVAFTAYFIVYHSFNAFEHQYEWLKSKKPFYSLKRFLGDLSTLSLISVAGLLLALYLLNYFGIDNGFFYLFVFISLLTLPHAVLFDNFYAERRKD